MVFRATCGRKGSLYPNRETGLANVAADPGLATEAVEGEGAESAEGLGAPSGVAEELGRRKYKKRKKEPVAAADLGRAAEATAESPGNNESP